MASTSPLKHRALKGATWAALGGNGAQVLAFVMFVLISRVVGPEAFGVIAVCLLLVELGRALTIESVAVNLVSRGRFEAREFHAGFAITAGLALLASAFLIAGAPLLAELLNIAGVRTVLPQIAPLLAIHAAARLLEAELTIRLEFRALAIRSVGAVALGGAAGIASAYAGYGVQALVLQQWVAAVVALVLLGLQARWRPGFGFSRDTAVMLARQSAAIAPAGVIANLRQSVDGLAVSAFSGAAAAGLYNLAKRTRLSLQLGLSAAIGRVSLPTFGMVRDEPKRLASAMHQALRLSAIIAFPIFIGVAAVAPELIEVFLGAAWRGAAAPMGLLMIGGALAIATRLCENLLLVNGRRGTIVWLNAAALGVLSVLIFIVGRLGPVGVAAAVLTTGVLQNLATWFATERSAPHLRTNAYLRHVWVPLVICVAMLGLLGWLRSAGFAADAPAMLRLLVYVAAGAVFYLAAAWVFARQALHDALSAGRVVLSMPARP